MTRLQKKCFMFSAGMHGLLLLILVASSAFREKPQTEEMPLFNYIPQTIVDGATRVSGGAAAPAPQQPQPPPQVAQPTPPQPSPPQPAKPVVQRSEPVTPVEPPRPHHIRQEPVEKPVADKGDLPSPKPTKPLHHEVVPSFTPVNPKTRKEIAKNQEADEERANARAQANRLNRVAQALDNMANRVRNSGAPGTAVDMPGQLDGPAFADYKTVIYNVYHRAWIVPDSVANNNAATDVQNRRGPGRSDSFGRDH